MSTLSGVAAFAICGIGGAVPLQAQMVSGTVQRADTEIPLSGAFARLVEVDGAEGAPFRTGADGRFVLTPIPKGPFVIQIERIGFAPWESPLLHPPVVGGESFEIQMAPLAMRLTDIQVDVDAPCHRIRDASRATLLLWDEARKAVEAASWNGRQADARYETTAYTRELDPRLRVLDEQRRATTYSSRPYASISVDSLATLGYIQTDADGNMYFYGLDAEVVFDERFLATHCIVARANHAEAPHLIGVGFEPISDATPDVAGVVWLDRASGELRYVEFQYVNLDIGTAADHAGGRVDFMPIGDGEWVITRWWIRTPLLRVNPLNPFPTRGRHGPPVELSGYSEDGGFVTAIRSRRGGTLFDLGRGVAAVTVVDSTSGTPLEGARVYVIEGRARGVTNTQGQAVLRDLPIGHLRIAFAHRRLDVLGIRIPETDLESQPGTIASATLAIPSVGVIIGERCPTVPPDLPGAVVGRVGDGTLDPADSISVRASWLDVGKRERPFVSANPSTEGYFFICGVPTTARLLIEARTMTGRTHRVSVRIPNSGLLELQLPIPR